MEQPTDNPPPPADDSPPRNRGLRTWVEGLDGPAVFVLLSSTVLLILFHENGSTSFFRVYLAGLFGPSRFGTLYPAFYWYGCSLLALGLVPAFLGRRVLHRPFTDLGLGLGDWKFGLPACLALYFAFLPVLLLISYHTPFQAKYPLFTDAGRSGLHFLFYEGSYALYFVGWEFIYRGYMLFGLRPALGIHAVFIQTIPFAIMHFGKPQLETLAAVVAGVVLGFLALRARSFWYGWLLHVLVAVTIDVMVLVHKGAAVFR